MPFTHQAQRRSLRAKPWGQSVCVHSPAFFTTSKCAPAWQIISLAELQHSHRPVRPIYLLCEEELTLEETRKWGFFFFFFFVSWSYCTVQHEQLPGGGRGGEICENAAHPTFHLNFLVFESGQTRENYLWGTFEVWIVKSTFQQIYSR